MERSKKGAVTLGLFATLFGLVLSELFLRGFYPCPTYGFKPVLAQRQFFQYDSTLGWSGRPMASGVFAGVDFYTAVTLDSLGHRSSTQPIVRGKKNVFVLGDSQGWGWGVSDDDIYSEVMMRRDGGLNVYNMCAPGYGTDQQYLAFKSFLERDSADGLSDVLLLFYRNDFADNSSTFRYYPKPRYHLEDGRLTLSNVPVPETEGGHNPSAGPQVLRRSFLHKFHTYNLFTVSLHKIRQRITNGGSASRPATHTNADGEDDERAPTADGGTRITVRLLEALRDVCEAHNASFHVVFVMPDEAQRWVDLAEGLSRSHIRFTEFHGRAFFKRTRLWLDNHLNENGHELLAEHLLGVLRKSRQEKG
jgi:lysophospholipase L1-like esterase